MPKAKLYIRRVGASTGAMAKLPESYGELLQVASTKLGLPTPATQCFAATGDVIDEDAFELVDDGDVVYGASLARRICCRPPLTRRVCAAVSCGEPWAEPGKAEEGGAAAAAAAAAAGELSQMKQERLQACA